MAEGDAALTLLGTPTLHRGEDAIHLSRKKAMALVSYLAVEDRPQSRDTVCGVFWPDLPQGSARRALRTVLSDLRRALPQGALQSNHEQVQCGNRDLLSVDVNTYSNLVASLNADVLEGRCETTDAEFGAIVAATELYRDDFMAGFFLSGCPRFDDWQFDTAELLRRRQATLLWLLSRHCSAKADYARAIDACRRLLALDQTDEEIHRELMRLFLRTNDKGAALRQFEHCKEILKTEFDDDPDEESVALYNEIRAAAPPRRHVRTLSPHPAMSDEIRLVSVAGVGLSEAGDDAWDTGSRATARAIADFHTELRSMVQNIGGEVVGELADDLVIAFGVARTSEDDPLRAVDVCRAALAIAGREGLSVSAAVRTGRLMWMHSGGPDHAGDRAEPMGPLINACQRQRYQTPPGAVSVCPDTYGLVREHVRARPGGGRTGASGGIDHYVVDDWVDARNLTHRFPVHDSTVPFVGRDDHLSRVVSAIKACVAGSGGAVLISGEAGIGKTRLVMEAREHAAHAGSDVLWFTTTCTERRRSDAFGAILPTIREMVDHIAQGSDRPLRARLEKVSAHLLAAGSIAPAECTSVRTCLERLLESSRSMTEAAGLPDESAFRRECCRALAALCETASHREPVVLQIEDLHWSDSATRAFLQALGPVTGRVPLLLVVSCRPDELEDPSVLNTIRREAVAPCTIVHLDELSPDSVRSLVRSLDADAEISEEAVEMITKRAAGNPLFATELARATVAEPESATIPLTVERLIRRRMDQLSPSRKAALQLVATFGVPVDTRMLDRASVLSGVPVMVPVAEGGARGLLVARPTDRGTEIEFGHPLMREVAYAGIVTETRALLHHAVGLTLEEQADGEQLQPDAAQELAHHFNISGDHARAARYLCMCGDVARRLFDDEQALRNYQRAVEHLDVIGDELELRVVYLKIGGCFNRRLQMKEAGKAFAKAFSLPDVNPPPLPAGVSRQASLSVATFSYDYSVNTLERDAPPDRPVQCLVSRTLVSQGADQVILPDAAESWDVSDDGRHCRFRIRDDAYWSDGAPVVSRDFLPGLGALCHQLNAPGVVAFPVVGYEEFLSTGNAADLGIHAVDEKILEIDLLQQNPLLFRAFACRVAAAVPSHVVSRYPTSWWDPVHNVYAGPFSVASIEPEGDIHLVRNEAYGLRTVGNITELTLVGLHTGDMIDAYATGKVDVTPVFGHLSRALEEYPDELQRSAAAGVDLLLLNPDHEQFTDCRTRQAIAHAIDRLAYTTVVHRGAHAPATGGIIPPVLPGHSPGIGLEFAPARARALMKAALGGSAESRLEFEIVALREQETDASYLSDQLSRTLGITVRPVVLSYDDISAAFDSETYDALLVPVGIIVPDPLMWFGTPHEVRDPDQLRLVLEASRAQSVDRRLQLLARADRGAVAMAVRIPLVNRYAYWLQRPSVSGVAFTSSHELRLESAIVRPRP